MCSQRVPPSRLRQRPPSSPAMIELARDYARGADFAVVRLPTGVDGALPEADAVVSTGHVLNYPDTHADIVQAL